MGDIGFTTVLLDIFFFFRSSPFGLSFLFFFVCILTNYYLSVSTITPRAYVPVSIEPCFRAFVKQTSYIIFKKIWAICRNIQVWAAEQMQFTLHALTHRP